MAAQMRRSWERTKLWPSGEYTLLADSYTAENRATYSNGDTLALNQWEATRLVNEGAIAPPSSMHAVRARTLGSPPPSLNRRPLAVAAASAHQPDVLLRVAAPRPHGDDVVEPHPLSARTPDAPTLVSPPHVHPHPVRGQRFPDLPGLAPAL
jgi:hypothetical protein